MFANFFKKPSSLERQLDQVWFDQAAKWQHLTTLAQNLAPPAWHLFIAYFPETLREFQTQLEGLGLTTELVLTPTDGAYLKVGPPDLPQRPVWLALAEALPSTFDFSPPTPRPAHFIVVEHYPLPAPGEVLMALATSWPGPAQLTFHTSLDEPLMKRFGGEGVQQLFHNLKIPENESIAAPLVNQTIAGTQKRLSRKVPVEQRAPSAEQWFQINLPPA